MSIEIKEEVYNLANNNKDFNFLCSHVFKYPYIYNCTHKSILGAYGTVEDFVDTFYNIIDESFFRDSKDIESNAQQQFNYIFATTFLAVCLDELTNYIISTGGELGGFVFDEPELCAHAVPDTLVMFLRTTNKRAFAVVELKVAKTFVPDQFNGTDILKSGTSSVHILVRGPQSRGMKLEDETVLVNKISVDLFNSLKQAIHNFKTKFIAG